MSGVDNSEEQQGTLMMMDTTTFSIHQQWYQTFSISYSLSPPSPLSTSLLSVLSQSFSPLFLSISFSLGAYSISLSIRIIIMRPSPLSLTSSLSFAFFNLTLTEFLIYFFCLQSLIAHISLSFLPNFLSISFPLDPLLKRLNSSFSFKSTEAKQLARQGIE